MSSSREVRPEIESLEDRCVPAAVVSGGDLVILQSNGNDSAIVSTLRVGYMTFIRVQETVDGYIQPDQYFSASQVGRIVYLGGAGDDYFQNFTAIRSIAYGGAGDDALYGGSNVDLLYGEAGNDELDGGDGNDQLFGGGGLDYLYGAAGNDYLNGGNDGIADVLDGGPGADTFEAEPYYPLFSVFNRAFNRDYPQDFNASEGDRIVGMPGLVLSRY